MVFYEQGHLVFFNNYNEWYEHDRPLQVRWGVVMLYVLAALLILGGCGCLVYRGRKNYRFVIKPPLLCEPNLRLLMQLAFAHIFYLHMMLA